MESKLVKLKVVGLPREVGLPFAGSSTGTKCETRVDRTCGVDTARAGRRVWRLLTAATKMLVHEEIE
jgi:hypothetical protein